MGRRKDHPIDLKYVSIIHQLRALRGECMSDEMRKATEAAIDVLAPAVPEHLKRAA